MMLKVETASGELVVLISRFFAEVEAFNTNPVEGDDELDAIAANV